MSSIAGVAASNRKNDAEVKRIMKQLNKLPDIAVKSVIRVVFPIAVRETVQDSGRAAYNWWIGKGKAQRRFYVDQYNLGPIGLPGEKRTLGGSLHQPASSSTISTNLIAGLKVAYMEQFLTTTDLSVGATMYNQTPLKNRQTFRGTYEGNAKIRVAMAKAMVEAQGAMDMALREFS